MEQLGEGGVSPKICAEFDTRRTIVEVVLMKEIGSINEEEGNEVDLENCTRSDAGIKVNRSS